MFKALLLGAPIWALAATCDPPAPPEEVVFVTEGGTVDVSPPETLVVIFTSDPRTWSEKCDHMGGEFRAPDMCWDVDY